MSLVGEVVVLFQINSGNRGFFPFWKTINGIISIKSSKLPASPNALIYRSSSGELSFDVLDGRKR